MRTFKLGGDKYDDDKLLESIRQRIRQIETIVFFMVVLHFISFTNQFRINQLKTYTLSESTLKQVEHVISTKLEKRIIQKKWIEIHAAKADNNKVGSRKESLKSPSKTSELLPLSETSPVAVLGRQDYQNESDPNISNTFTSRLLKVERNQSINHAILRNNTNSNGGHCVRLPALSPRNQVNNFEFDSRIENILEIIHSLSPINLIHDFQSAQYKAACYIIFDDIVGTSLESEKLIQRYSLSVFLYTTNQLSEFPLPHSICDMGGSRIDCNKEGHITKIDWGKYPTPIKSICFTWYLIKNSDEVCIFCFSSIDR